MTQHVTEQPAETRSVRIDHAAAVTARMPTPEECNAGFPLGVPVLVVADSHGRDKVFPHWVTVTFDDPHGQPEPDAVRDTAAYVLGVIGEHLGNARADLARLARALGQSPCSVTHLADEVREREDELWYCADNSLCRFGQAFCAT